MFATWQLPTLTSGDTKQAFRASSKAAQNHKTGSSSKASFLRGMTSTGSSWPAPISLPAAKKRGETGVLRGGRAWELVCLPARSSLRMERFYCRRSRASPRQKLVAGWAAAAPVRCRALSSQPAEPERPVQHSGMGFFWAEGREGEGEKGKANGLTDSLPQLQVHSGPQGSRGAQKRNLKPFPPHPAPRLNLEALMKRQGEATRSSAQL